MNDDVNSGGNLWTTPPSESRSQFSDVDPGDFDSDLINWTDFDEEALEERLEKYRRKRPYHPGQSGTRY